MNVVQSAAQFLSTKGPRPSWPLYWSHLDLTQSEQDWLRNYPKYAAKWPTLMASDGFAPPPAGNAEQASSEATARWKGRWMHRLTGKSEGVRALDLTAGSGIDVWGLELAGAQVTAVEPDPYLAKLLQWNGADSGREVRNMAAEEVPAPQVPYDLIYVDPSRRPVGGGTRLALRDWGEPNPLKHLDQWLEWGETVVLKLSPMLDRSEVLRQLPQARELIYLSWNREVKELLVRCCREDEPIRVVGVACGDQGETLLEVVHQPNARPGFAAEVGSFLYDPDPALSASGGVAAWAAQYGLSLLHADARLATDTELRVVPGCRVFAVTSVSTTFPKDLKAASVVARAFPERAEAIRARHRLLEDSECFLFATKLAAGSGKVYVVARRIDPTN